MDEIFHSDTSDLQDMVLRSLQLVCNGDIRDEDGRGLRHWLADALRCVEYRNYHLAGEILRNVHQRIERLLNDHQLDLLEYSHHHLFIISPRGPMSATTDKINANRPELWKADILASIDQFNKWFMTFAPEAFRSTRVKTTLRVKESLAATNDLRAIGVDVLKSSPATLSTLRMCTAPPLAVDRLIGLANANKSLIGRMEEGKLAARIKPELLHQHLESVCRVLAKLLDRDIFPWLDAKRNPTGHERDRAATVVADRLCSAVANPIVRNAQEQRQLALIAEYLDHRGYRHKPHAVARPLTDMEPGTYAFRMNIPVGDSHKVKIPVDVVIQPVKLPRNRLPILIEAKSAGDFTNTNKRRKEEATKIHQLQASLGSKIKFVLFLCGYFGSDYLGYEAAEGIDWIWEHRIADLAKLGL